MQAGRRPRIGVLTSMNIGDKTVHSGMPFEMARNLQRHAGEIVNLGPLRAVMEPLGKIRNRLSRAVSGRRHGYVHNLLLAREYAWRFRRRIVGVDVIFAPFGSTQIALLDSPVPILYVSDTTFDLMRDYYPSFSGFSDSDFRQGERIESLAMSRAAAFTCPSPWAAESATLHYGKSADTVHVVPFGANIDAAPDALELAAAKRRVLADRRCQLLLVGVEWDRKGGQVAYDALQSLRRSGVDAELTIVGCEPPAALDRTHMRVIPRLDKRSSADREAFRDLMLHAHFMLLPTRAECYGLVICEASAHGTPTLAADTGGVSGALTHGVNGELLPASSDGDAYAARIIALLADTSRYEELMRGSRRLYDEKLNWDHWAREMARVIGTII